MHPIVLKRVRVAACVTMLSLFSMLPAAAGAPLPARLAVDVNESYRLLAKTYYHPVDDQTLLDAARASIADLAHKHGAAVTVADIRAGGDADETMTALDSAIADAAEASHGSPTDFAYAAIAGMAKAVDDKYTQFMTPDDFKHFNDALDPERITGIGVLIAPGASSGLITVSYVLPGTPADRAGLQSGDIIASIDGSSTKGLTVDVASKLLRGKPGSLVHLIVQHGSSDGKDVAITRSEIQPPTVVYKMLPNDIGYVYVIAFGKETPSEFDVALTRLKDQGAKGLVLDLRNDGGGYVDSALDISSRFIAQKPLLTVQQRGLPDTTIQAPGDASIAVPVTVLVNEYTASASEITAGALQDDGIGVLIGTRTFGKGVMQTLTPLPDGAAIKITTAHYLTPRHRDINLKGIDPDVRVDENRDARFGDVASDAQLREALAFLQKKIALAKP